MERTNQESRHRPHMNNPNQCLSNLIFFIPSQPVQVLLPFDVHLPSRAQAAMKIGRGKPCPEGCQLESGVVRKQCMSVGE